MIFQNNELTALFISHVNPVYRAAGNEIRVFKMINWLRAEGVHVVLLLNLPPISSEIRKQLLKIVHAVYTPEECPPPFPTRIITTVSGLILRPSAPRTEWEKMRSYLGSPALIQATGVLCKKYSPRVVIAEYVFATPCLREVPSGVLKVVDTHDLLSKRDPKESIYCSAEEERDYLLNADVVIAIQDIEAEQFRTLVPERKVVTVGIDFDVVRGGNTGGECKNTVMVVGSNYPANIEGLKAFCEYAWPIVCKKNPRAELLVAGKIGDAIISNIPQVKVLGWVDDLQALYRQSSVVINPTMTGTGLKIKTVEALCNGKPLVATQNAVEGLVFEGEAPCMVYDNWPEFAGAVIFLLESDERRLALHESALRYARDQFAGSKVYAQLEAILRSQVQ
jgi:glycosyltransferase involved in cell wall biosynthesis